MDEDDNINIDVTELVTNVVVSVDSVPEDIEIVITQPRDGVDGKDGHSL